MNDYHQRLEVHDGETVVFRDQTYRLNGMTFEDWKAAIRAEERAKKSNYSAVYQDGYRDATTALIEKIKETREQYKDCLNSPACCAGLVLDELLTHLRGEEKWNPEKDPLGYTRLTKEIPKTTAMKISQSGIQEETECCCEKFGEWEKGAVKVCHHCAIHGKFSHKPRTEPSLKDLADLHYHLRDMKHEPEGCLFCLPRTEGSKGPNAARFVEGLEKTAQRSYPITSEEKHVHSVDCGHCAHWAFKEGCKSCENPVREKKDK